MKVTILGGGLAGLSLAYFLQDEEAIREIEIIEKEATCGGLCRSFSLDGVYWDIGPHILFSKNEETLDFMLRLLNGNNAKIRRSNRILHSGRKVQYPFENDLSKLPEDDREFCVNAFLNNPYEDYNPANMLQFFLHTFGEGITNLYLRPYNEKIWKFDPSFLDLQMVGRIPKPPREDIINSASGQTLDGYLHQLYFHYPMQGGIQALVHAFADCLDKKISISTGESMISVQKTDDGFIIETNSRNLTSNHLISTIPVNELCMQYSGAPDSIQAAGDCLRYNSIAVIIMQLSKDFAGDNFAFMIADKNVIFHRISKIDFLGQAYHKENTVTLMIEITYRKNDIISKYTDDELINKAIDGLHKVRFMDSDTVVINSTVKRFDYAYVVYDLMHKSNMERIRNYFTGQGVYLNGRFGNFEYLNMDAVIDESRKLSVQIKDSIRKEVFK